MVAPKTRRETHRFSAVCGVEPRAGGADRTLGFEAPSARHRPRTPAIDVRSHGPLARAPMTRPGLPRPAHTTIAAERPRRRTSHAAWPRHDTPRAPDAPLAPYIDDEDFTVPRGNGPGVAIAIAAAALVGLLVALI